MNEGLLIAGLFAVATGLGHSYLGERLILVPLFRGDGVPATRLGSAAKTMLMLRATWHFFTIVVLSTAVLFFSVAGSTPQGGDATAVRVVAAYWAAFSALVLVLSRGRHFAWALMLGTAATAWWGTL